MKIRTIMKNMIMGEWILLVLKTIDKTKNNDLLKELQKLYKSYDESLNKFLNENMKEDTDIYKTILDKEDPDKISIQAVKKG